MNVELHLLQLLIEHFDAANANRMICIYRSLPSEGDQKILAYGCLGLQTEQDQRSIDYHLERIISGLCQGYRRILHSTEIPKIFHDRDFIYMLRELRFELANIHENQETSVGEITPRSLLRALEENFNGIQHEEFEKLVEIFFTAVNEKCPSFRLLSSIEKQQIQRNIPTILRESMKLDPIRRRLYGRYKLIIDESEDESAVRLLPQTHILDSDPNRTNIFSACPTFPMISTMNYVMSRFFPLLNSAWKQERPFSWLIQVVFMVRSMMCSIKTFQLWQRMKVERFSRK